MIARMILFGASGDLTSRLLMPAVAELAEDGRLPDGFSVVGSANVEWSTADFREHIATALARHASHVEPAARDRVVETLSFVPGDVTQATDIRRALGDERGHTLIYLALPPSLLTTVLPALAVVDLQGSDAIAIEKPFGTDLASAQHLNEILRASIPLPTVFRIDHFLSNELVRRIVALRFLNRIFESSWNAMQIERVDISWLERLALEGRAGYYDRAGALKDMLQNHLMVAMSLVLMEQPARIDAISFRSTRVEALRAVATPSREHIHEHTVRARYTAGRIADRDVRSYLDEAGVVPDRGTETYASVTLDVENSRWAGVPITLRSGKALAQDSAEIAVHFLPLPRYMRERFPEVEPNVLRLGLSDPYVALTTTLNGPDRNAETRDLELRSTPMKRSPYANLILEMFRSDPTLFIRGDEAEEAWRIVGPIMKEWADGAVPMQTYPAGGNPPASN